MSNPTDLPDKFPGGFPAELQPRFLPMTPADVPSVMAIEDQSFPTPWSDLTYYGELRNRTGSYWVVRPMRKPRPAGVPPLFAYAGLWLLGEEVHVTTIAVHPDWRRRHLGEWLLIHLLQTAREGKAESVTLEVRVRNRPAIELYHKLGFKTVGLRRGYYRDTGEDARLLTLSGLQDDTRLAAWHARLSEIEATAAPPSV